jgi:hypothetical protein
MSVRKAKAELQKLKEAAAKAKLLPNGGIILVNKDRGETREQALAQLGIDPESEGLIFVEMSDADLRL